MTLRRRQKGFTLIELLVVVAIMGILAAISLALYVNVQARGRIARAQADVGILTSAVSAFSAHTGNIPTNGEGLAVLETTATNAQGADRRSLPQRHAVAAARRLARVAGDLRVSRRHHERGRGRGRPLRDLRRRRWCRRPQHDRQHDVSVGGRPSQPLQRSGRDVRGREQFVSQVVPSSGSPGSSSRRARTADRSHSEPQRRGRPALTVPTTRDSVWSLGASPSRST